MEEREFYELTNPQKSIYYTEQKYRGTTITNISGTVHIKTKIDFKKLIYSQEFKNDQKFKVVTVTHGEGIIITDSQIKLSKGQSILIPACINKYTIKGNLEVLICN